MPFSTFNKVFKAASLATLASLIQLGSALFTAPALSGTLVNNWHSLSIQWTRSDEIIQGANQSREIHPETASLQYSYQLSENWHSSASVWSGLVWSGAATSQLNER